jgi:hypothetical protein
MSQDKVLKQMITLKEGDRFNFNNGDNPPMCGLLTVLKKMIDSLASTSSVMCGKSSITWNILISPFLVSIFSTLMNSIRSRYFSQEHKRDQTGKVRSSLIFLIYSLKSCENESFLNLPWSLVFTFGL